MAKGIRKKSSPNSTDAAKSAPPDAGRAVEPPKVDAQLAKLQAADIVRRLVEEIDPTFAFKHTLVQETTYDSMLKSKRSELHRLVAETIEKLAPDQLEQNAAVLAYHYHRGGWDDLAFIYAALAGDVAWRAYAQTEALTHYNLALAIAERLDSNLFNSRIRTVFAKRGRIFEVLGESAAAIANYQTMIEFAQRANDPLMEAEGLNHLVTVRSVSTGAHTTDADRHLERALELARQANDQALIGRTLWNRGLIRRFSDPTRAIEYFQQALEFARSAGLGELAGYALTELTIQLEMVGRVHGAREYADQALEEFRKLDNKPMIVDALANRAITAYYMGEVDVSRAASDEGIRISQETENLWGILFHHIATLQMAEDAGEFDRLLTEGEEHLRLTRKVGFPPFRGFALGVLSRTFLQLGQVDRAEDFANECIQAVSQMNAPTWTNLAVILHAAVALERGRLDDAQALLEPLRHAGDNRLKYIFSLQLTGWVVPKLALIQGRFDDGIEFCDWIIAHYTREQAWRLACDHFYYRGVLYHARGDLGAAERDLEQAREIAERTSVVVLLWRIHAARAKLFMQRDQTQQAAEAYRCAAEIIHALTKNVSDAALRESFLSRLDVREVLEHLPS